MVVAGQGGPPDTSSSPAQDAERAGSGAVRDGSGDAAAGEVRTARGRLRRPRHEDAGRPHRLNTRFTDVELESVLLAAALAGMTPTGYVAQAALDLASARTRPAGVTGAAVTGALQELIEARYQVRKFGVLMNQTVAKWHSTDEVPAEVARVVALVSRAVARVEQTAGELSEAYGVNLIRRAARGARGVSGEREVAGGSGTGAGVPSVEGEAWDGVEVHG